MIRTFLIYTLLDKCLDMFFERVEMAFVPFEGCRVGDRFRKIVIRNSDSSCDLVTTFHNCRIEGIFSFIDISFEYSTIVHKFKNSYAAWDYMERRIKDINLVERNVSTDGLTIVEMFNSSGAWIKPDHFMEAEKVR